MHILVWFPYSVMCFPLGHTFISSWPHWPWPETCDLQIADDWRGYWTLRFQKENILLQVISKLVYVLSCFSVLIIHVTTFCCCSLFGYLMLMFSLVMFECDYHLFTDYEDLKQSLTTSAIEKTDKDCSETTIKSPASPDKHDVTDLKNGKNCSLLQMC